jgi:hypothetical protein
MNFTPKINGRTAVSGILTIAVVGWIGWLNNTAPARAPAATTQSATAIHESYRFSDSMPVIPAVDVRPEYGLQTAGSGYYQPVSSWYKSKHWWKRNAPIVGGAAGGALIGGLAGGGTGAVIGGAAGGGGGYLYKRLKHDHHRHNQNSYRK